MTNTIFLCALLAAGVASIANVVNAIAVVEPKSTASFAVAPKITASVYEEAMPMLYGKWPIISGFDEFSSQIKQCMDLFYG